MPVDRFGVLWHSRGGYGRLLLDLVLVKMGLLLGDDSFGGHDCLRKFVKQVWSMALCPVKRVQSVEPSRARHASAFKVVE